MLAEGRPLTDHHRTTIERAIAHLRLDEDVQAAFTWRTNPPWIRRAARPEGRIRPRGGPPDRICPHSGASRGTRLGDAVRPPTRWTNSSESSSRRTV